MLAIERAIKNPFLQLYLEYVEETETPRIMHIWTALSGVGACLGRRVYFPFGFNNIYANMFVLLVGPPGSRKSTALGIMQRRLRKTTGVRFAPEDTGGQRQGLIIAIENKDENIDDADKQIMQAAVKAANLDVFNNFQLSIDPRDANVIFAVASEFGSFIGNNSIEMVTFLNKLYDGENYDYKIRANQHVLNDPLLSFIGGTTPTNIQDCLPKSAIGHGFTSRIILVHANRKYKRIPRPSTPDSKLERSVDGIFKKLFYKTDGELGESKQAKQALADFYEGPSDLNDGRFVYYLDRRQQHLIKLAMNLTVARGSMKMERSDIEEADLILRYTEKFMPDALGEYGLSPLATAKQHMVEFLIHAKGPVSDNILWAVMQRDMKIVDFKNSLMDLANAGKIMLLKTSQGEAWVYIDKEAQETETLVDLVAEGLEDETEDREYA